MNTSNQQNNIIFFENIDCVVIDLDNTLLVPYDEKFYLQYPPIVERAIASTLNIDSEDALQLANYYREEYGSADYFFGDKDRMTVVQRILDRDIDSVTTEIDYMTLYPYFLNVDVSSYFGRNDDYASFIRELKQKGKKIVAFSNGHADIAQKILSIMGLDLTADFDYALLWGHNILYPAKSVDLIKSLDIIRDLFDIPEHRVLFVGDSLRYDVIPEVEAGYKVCAVGEQKYNIGIIPSVTELINIKVQ